MKNHKKVLQSYIEESKEEIKMLQQEVRALQQEVRKKERLIENIGQQITTS